MSETVVAHLTAIKASMELLRVQVAGLEHQLETEARQAESVNAATVDIPERCSGIEPRACAIQHDDSRIDFGSFADPHRWQCRGCGFDSGVPNGSQRAS